MWTECGATLRVATVICFQSLLFQNLTFTLFTHDAERRATLP